MTGLRSEYCLHCDHGIVFHHPWCSRCDCKQLVRLPARKSYRFSAFVHTAPGGVKAFPFGRITNDKQLERPAHKRYYESG